MRALGLPLVLTLVLLTGCDDGSPPADAAPGPDALSDGGAPDTLAPDAAGPLANVYKQNPVEDKKTTTVVELQHLTDPDGKLSGKYADVWNCLNEDGGETFNVDVLAGLTASGKVCHQVQHAVPGTDGTYLHITPPASDGDGSDSFAEVMMYHHVTTIHDHYWNTFGLAHLENKKMRALVNVQVFIDMLGMWLGILNAAYVPAQTGSILKQYFGVDLNKGEDAIIFLQDSIYNVDIAYEAAAIYHEYTHAAIGANALWEPAKDAHGLDPTPKALNEALADYLPCSFLDNPKHGTYALAAADSMRDLTEVYTCPEHVIGEEHYDGQVASSALWSMRQILGAQVADKAIWNAALTFGMSTTFEEAAKAIVDEVKKLAPDKESQVQQLFVDRGMQGCVRLVDHVDFTGGGARGSPTYAGAMPATFPDGTPAFIQYRVPLAATTQEVTIEYVPSAGTFMGLPIGGAKGDVHVALRKGSEPITYDYSSGQAVSTAQAVLQGADTGTAYKLVLSGDCISQGDLVFQFLNKGADGGTLTKVTVTQSATVTNTADNFTGCSNP
jgi:hypothetical protein